MRLVLVLVLGATAACAASAPAEDPVPPEVTGAITQIERDEGGEIVAFTVLAEREATYEIRIDPTHDYGFDLEHLEEHRTTGQPVKVTTERRDDAAYAVEILDA